MTIPLTTAETTAVLRWVPHLEADRRELFGSNMTLHYFADTSSVTVALTQITIALMHLQAIGEKPGAPPYPPVLITDMLLLGRIAFRVNGLNDEQIAAIDKHAQDVAAQLHAAVRDDEPTKH